MTSITERVAERKPRKPSICGKCGLAVNIAIDSIMEAVEAGEKPNPLYRMLLESHRKTCLKVRS